MSFAEGELGRQRGQRRQLAWTLGLLALAAVIVAVAALAGGGGGGTPVAGTSPGPAATPSEPTPSVPMSVDVRAEQAAAIGNGRLFGRDVRADEGVAEDAAREVGEVLEEYLNAEFVSARTRFTEGPLTDLLTPQAAAALTADDRAGLGALDVAAQRVEGEPVRAAARVQIRGDHAAVVTVEYAAQARVYPAEGDPVALRQEATMVFVPVDGAWRADAVDASLDLPSPAGVETS